jgi:hypothetical protein
MKIRDDGATCNPSLLSEMTFSIVLFMTGVRGGAVG